MDSYFIPFLDPQLLMVRYNEISRFLHRTPILTSKSLDFENNASLFFKCENFQKSGAFKMRGVSNAIFELLLKKEKPEGVVAHSSGNHGQALAWAAQSHDIPCKVVMPSNASEFKKKAVLAAGAEIIECFPTILARKAAVKKVCKNSAFIEIHPSNQPSVILGQGSAAWELLEDCQQRDVSLGWIGVPIGGGGLAAGTGFAVSVWNNLHGTATKVFCGEPSGADDAFRSLISGKIEFNKNPYTVADGLRTELGDINFPIIKKTIKEIYLVSDKEILEGQIKLAERLKIVLETNCSPPFSAICKNLERFNGKKVGIIISGGNVDLRSSVWGE